MVYPTDYNIPFIKNHPLPELPYYPQKGHVVRLASNAGRDYYLPHFAVVTGVSFDLGLEDKKSLISIRPLVSNSALTLQLPSVGATMSSDIPFGDIIGQVKGEWQGPHPPLAEEVVAEELLEFWVEDATAIQEEEQLGPPMDLIKTVFGEYLADRLLKATGVLRQDQAKELGAFFSDPDNRSANESALLQWCHGSEMCWKLKSIRRMILEGEQDLSLSFAPLNLFGSYLESLDSLDGNALNVAYIHPTSPHNFSNSHREKVKAASLVLYPVIAHTEKCCFLVVYVKQHNTYLIFDSQPRESINQYKSALLNCQATLFDKFKLKKPWGPPYWKLVQVSTFFIFSVSLFFDHSPVVVKLHK